MNLDIELLKLYNRKYHNSYVTFFNPANISIGGFLLLKQVSSVSLQLAHHAI